MINLLHLTDLHLSANRADAPEKRALLREIAGMLTSFPRPVSAVIVSGDLTDTGDLASYALLHEMVAEFSMPVLLALGNHDRRESFRAVFAREGTPDAPCLERCDLGAVQVLVLDTLVPGRVSGALGPEQLQWLVKTLSEAPEKPSLLVLHHPPRLDPKALRWASLDDRSTAALAEAITGYRVLGILAGHIHLDRMALWQGVPVITNVGLHYAVDPLAGNGLKMVESLGFGVIRLVDKTLSALWTRLRPVPSGRGEVPLELLSSYP